VISDHNRRDFLKTISCASLCLFAGGLGCTKQKKTSNKTDSDMKEMIACCGIPCHECGAFIATKNNDDKKRKEVAEQWSKQFNADIKPEAIYCDGCLSKDGYLFSHCNVCEIRKCAMEKKLANCAHCNEYPCEKLKAFHQMVPDAKKVLDEIHQAI
jgi:hypothetical protein